MKTKQELELLKQECETLTSKLQELTQEELRLVVGGNTGFKPNSEGVYGNDRDAYSEYMKWFAEEMKKRFNQ